MLLKRLFKVKIEDTSDNRRLAVVPERALREHFDREHYAAVLKAREEWFQNTPQIKKVSK